MVDVGRLRPCGDREGLCTLLSKRFMRANWPEIALFSTRNKSALSLSLYQILFPVLDSGTKCHVVTACCYIWGVKGIKKNALVLRWSSTAEPIFFMSINKEWPVKRQLHDNQANPVYSFYGSIWRGTHWKRLEREGPFKKKNWEVIGWTCYQISPKRTVTFFFYCQLNWLANTSKLPVVVRGDRCVSPPRGEPQRTSAFN